MGGMPDRLLMSEAGRAAAGLESVERSKQTTLTCCGWLNPTLTLVTLLAA